MDEHYQLLLFHIICYRSSFVKYAAAWDKQNKYSLASDIVQEFTKRKLIVSSPTRWNSYYNVIVWITKSNNWTKWAVHNVEITVLYWQGNCFLKEYCAVLQPLARGLDILQKEDNCFYGALLPALEIIINKTKALIPDLSAVVAGFATYIETSIEHRFVNVFGNKTAILASLTLPKFKLRWINGQIKKKVY